MGQRPRLPHGVARAAESHYSPTQVVERVGVSSEDHQHVCPPKEDASSSSALTVQDCEVESGQAFFGPARAGERGTQTREHVDLAIAGAGGAS
jgi:hypothetical protein